MKKNMFNEKAGKNSLSGLSILIIKVNTPPAGLKLFD